MKVVLEINIIGDYDKAFFDKGMKQLGERVINEVKKNVRKMGLVAKGGGQYLQNWFSSWDGKELTIENTQEYAVYLEYGTFSYFSNFGFESFPESPDPKKKNMTRELAKTYPRGCQPFAPVRRVLYNELLMKKLVELSFK